MATSASDFVNVYSQMFEDMFNLDYQARGRLRGTVRTLHGLVGDAYKLKYMDQVSMDKHGAVGADIPAKSVSTRAPTISFENYELKLVIDKFDQLDFNASALSGYSRTHSKSIGRREDQFIIDALVAGATKTVAAGGTNLNVAKLRDAKKQLGQDEIGNEDDLTIILHANNLDSLLAQTEVSNSNYNTIKALVQGEINTFMGFKFIVLGDRSNEGGLPSTANVRKIFVFAKDALTLGYRMDPSVIMEDERSNARVSTLSTMSAGCVVGDAKGVVQISCDES